MGTETEEGERDVGAETGGGGAEEGDERGELFVEGADGGVVLELGEGGVGKQGAGVGLCGEVGEEAVVVGEDPESVQAEEGEEELEGDGEEEGGGLVGVGRHGGRMGGCGCCTEYVAVSR